MFAIVCRKAGMRWGRATGYWAAVETLDNKSVGKRALRSNSKKIKILGKYPWEGTRTTSWENARKMAKQVMEMYVKRMPDEEKAAAILMGTLFEAT